jgi:hypothetical protein
MGMAMREFTKRKREGEHYVPLLPRPIFDEEHRNAVHRHIPEGES